MRLLRGNCLNPLRETHYLIGARKDEIDLAWHQGLGSPQENRFLPGASCDADRISLFRVF